MKRRKFAIRSQITGETTIGELREARLAYEQLLGMAPDRTEELQKWFAELIRETVSQMKSQVGKLSEMSGTILTRAELLCKILTLQADPENPGSSRTQCLESPIANCLKTFSRL